MKKNIPRAIIQASVAALVLALPALGRSQTLTHRYSFNDNFTNSTFVDSVGGANWTGTNMGNAYLDGSQLQLDGNGSWAQLPAGMVSSYSQVTIEFWATLYDSNPYWTRVFAFGDQSGTAENTGLDYCHYAGGNWQNLNIQTGAGGGYANNPGGLNGRTNVHVTVVVDPTSNNMFYYNGTALMSSLNGSVPALNGINDAICLLGKSLFDVDPTLAGSLDEFRVYSGILPKPQLALNDAAGPNNIVTNPGPVQALHFSSPVNPILVNQNSQQILTGDFTNVTGLDLISYGGATFTSQNTSVLTINSNGVVKGISPGTANVVASFGGLNATNSLTVIAAPAVLTHRYSFATDASDSIGGANGTLYGGATVSGGQLTLDGVYGSYVDLPGNILNIPTNNAITVEAWVNFGAPATWAYLFGFGNTNSGGGQNQIGCIPASEGGGFRHWGITENFGGGRTLGWSHAWSNMTAHITCVVDPPSGTISIYRDGVLEVAEYDASSPLSNVPTNYAFIGRSFYDADPYLQASIDEFRIYSGALSPVQVALTQQEGPNATSLDPGALSSIVVVATNYPANSALIAPLVLANYANIQNVNLLPTVTAGGNAFLSGPQGLVVTSSDTNVISVNAQNMLTTHRPGTVTLSATFGGKTSSAVVAVRNMAVLTHRYSFNVDGDASDSVGGANGTLQGAATVSGGQLQLTGQNTDYLDLPPNLLNGYNAVTVDTWVNLGAAQHWARLWEFTDIGGGTQNEFYFAPGWNSTPNANFYNAGFPWGGNVTVNVPLQNELLHITCLYGNGSIEVYTNGVLEGSVTGLVAPASSAGNVSATIGHSPFNDPGINGSVDEFRIYNGRLAPDEIVATDVIGRNALPTTVATLSAQVSGGNVVLSWPVAAAGFSIQARSAFGTGGWTTLSNAPVLVGNTWQVTLPATGAAQFYRLWR